MLATKNLLISASEEEIKNFTINVATYNVKKCGYELSVDDVEEWLKNNVKEEPGKEL